MKIVLRLIIMLSLFRFTLAQINTISLNYIQTALKRAIDDGLTLSQS